MSEHGTPQRRALSIVAHLGCVLGGFVTPLVVYLIVGTEGGRARDGARNALNFQLTYLVVVSTGVVAAIIAAIADGLSSAIGVVAVIAFVCSAAIMTILNYVWSITAALRASRGEPFEYPISIRFIRG